MNAQISKGALIGIISMLGLALTLSASAAKTRTPIAAEQAAGRAVAPMPKSLLVPIWGAGASVGSSDGEFANAFVQATSFPPGTNSNSWTALSIRQSNGAVTPGAAFWTRTTTGVSAGAYAVGMQPVNSPTQPNGVALFDSDFLDNAGTQGAFGVGTSPSPHRGDLISPRIDLTGYANTPIGVRFYANYREFDITEFSVSLSTDDGVSWAQPVSILSLIGNVAQGFVEARFLTATNGVADLTRCRVRFTFDGDYYFAIIDDLTVGAEAPVDLAIGVVNAASNTQVERGDVLQFTGSRYFPANQLSARNFAYSANVRNLGFDNLLVSQNPELELLIERDVNGTWTEVARESVAINQGIAAGGFAQISGQLSNTAWAQPGEYRATYRASFNGVENTSNNSQTHQFTLTEYIYASKVDRLVDGFPQASQGTSPVADLYDKLEYGSVHYLDNGTGPGLSVSTVALTFLVPNGFNGTDRQVALNVYSVDASTASLSDRSQLTLIGTCSVYLAGLGTTIPAGQYINAECGPFSPDNVTPMPPLVTGHYFVSAAIEVPGGFTITQVPWIGASTAKNYNLNEAASAVGNLFAPQVLELTRSGMAPDWYASGYAGNVTPSIGIRFRLPDLAFANGFE